MQDKTAPSLEGFRLPSRRASLVLGPSVRSLFGSSPSRRAPSAAKGKPHSGWPSPSPRRRLRPAPRHAAVLVRKRDIEIYIGMESGLIVISYQVLCSKAFTSCRGLQTSFQAGRLSGRVI